MAQFLRTNAFNSTVCAEFYIPFSKCLKNSAAFQVRTYNDVCVAQEKSSRHWIIHRVLICVGTFQGKFVELQCHCEGHFDGVYTCKRAFQTEIVQGKTARVEIAGKSDAFFVAVIRVQNMQNCIYNAIQRNPWTYFNSMQWLDFDQCILNASSC